MTQQISANLALPYIQPAQAQKHVTHNEAIRILDALVQAVVQEPPRNTAPASADEGARYLIGSAPAGDWAGHADAIAWRTDGAWSFLAPQPGWAVRVLSDGSVRSWTGAAWQADGLPQVTDRLGINTSADATNRLAVASEATLLTHAGGSHRLTVNKDGASDTASLLFQTGFAGRAEMGTAGSDAFDIKVSADGSTWSTGLSVAPDTGIASFPAGARTSVRADIPGRWNCESDNSWVTFSQSYGIGSGQISQGAGIGAEPDLDWTHLGPLIPGGATMRRFHCAFRLSSDEITGLDVRVCFQSGPWQTGWNDAAQTVRTQLGAVDDFGADMGFTVLDMDLGAFVTPADGYFLVFIRPRGTLAATRFAYSSAYVDYLSPT